MGAAGGKNCTIHNFGNVLCLYEDSKSAAGARYATFALFSVACGGGERFVKEAETALVFVG